MSCQYVEDINAEFDVLLSDSLKRTVKLMIAINKGVDILSLNWLVESEKANKLLPTSGYLLRDEEMEQKLHFTVADVLAKVRAERQGLFHGRTFYLSKGVVPAYKELKVVIESAAGRVVTQPSREALHVFHETKEKALLQQHKEQGYTICSSESILEAIIQRHFDIPHADN